MMNSVTVVMGATNPVPKLNLIQTLNLNLILTLGTSACGNEVDLFYCRDGGEVCKLSYLPFEGCQPKCMTLYYFLTTLNMIPVF